MRIGREEGWGSGAEAVATESIGGGATERDSGGTGWWWPVRAVTAIRFR